MAFLLEKCPVCKARLDDETRWNAGCPRCGAELEAQLKCIRRATLLQTQCRNLLAAGRNAEAPAAGRRAFFLCDDLETRRTLAAALWANRSIHAALSLLCEREKPDDR